MFYSVLDLVYSVVGALANPVIPEETGLPRQIRVSTASATGVGLLKGKLDAEPMTACLMTYKAEKFTSNCWFCSQARKSQSKAQMLSRVTWPAFPTRTVLEQLENAVQAEKIKRVCVQALNYPEVFSDISAFVEALKKRVSVEVSVSCQPLSSQNLWFLSRAGVDRVGIALDAATEKLFNEVKGAAADGPYKWKDEFLLLRVAVGVFGEGNVSTHLIVGLGETEQEAVGAVQTCVGIGVLPALFAFTPVSGTALASHPQPKIDAYRRVQLARHLIVRGLTRRDDMSFDGDGRLIDFGVSRELVTDIVESGKPFLTSGCPNCNRPFYNEKPSGPVYNFPRSLRPEELAAVKSEVGM